MPRKMMVLMLVLALGLAFAPAQTQAEQKNLVLATATTGGTFYPVGVAIGTLISVKLAKKHKITATAINSAGAAENIQMLKNKECDLALMANIIAAMAYQGKGKFEGKPMQEFRAITNVWENVEQYVLLNKYVKTGNISDLKGLNQKFSFGKRGSGAEANLKILLPALGVDPKKDLIAEYLGYGGGATAMIDGRIAGANLVAGPPVAAISQLFAQLGGDKVSILEFTKEQMDKANQAYPIWAPYTIKAGTYPGQKKDFNVLAQPAFLCARPDVPEDVVYLITKTIHENVPFLMNIHKITKAISLERALAGLMVPLHPGAIKYYKEMGVKIPEKLIPKN
jgi:TRAP transporter TAXI family solute receptor